MIFVRCRETPGVRVADNSTRVLVSSIPEACQAFHFKVASGTVIVDYPDITAALSWSADKLKLSSIAATPPRPTPRKLRKATRDADLRGASQSLHQRSASMGGLKNFENKGHSRMPSLSGMLSTAKRFSLQRRGSDETVNPSASPYDLIPVEI
ncbi:hypothetical protein D6C91_04348 [Aureobasidium pullulans]|uniref:Uncharacterized protein n=1 Tax=Aureobasidium pullulans TaxID=5580 RepID=A0A4S9TAC5_AURPU|nr:hypothetical protein D6C91_04348 [Aureobasidium pullulans]